jgi:hypothetical protein
MNMNRIDDIDALSEKGRSVHPVGLRASDSDRSATAELLRKQYAAGRLDAEEFEQRVGRCYTAKTVGELRELVLDLPQGEVKVLARDSVNVWRRPVGRRALLVPLVVAAVALSSLTGAHMVWLVWPVPFVVLKTGPWRGRQIAAW